MTTQKVGSEQFVKIRDDGMQWWQCTLQVWSVRYEESRVCWKLKFSDSHFDERVTLSRQIESEIKREGRTADIDT